MGIRKKRMRCPGPAAAETCTKHTNVNACQLQPPCLPTTCQGAATLSQSSPPTDQSSKCPSPLPACLTVDGGAHRHQQHERSHPPLVAAEGHGHEGGIDAPRNGHRPHAHQDPGNRIAQADEQVTCAKCMCIALLSMVDDVGACCCLSQRNAMPVQGRVPPSVELGALYIASPAALSHPPHTVLPLHAEGS